MTKNFLLAAIIMAIILAEFFMVKSLLTTPNSPDKYDIAVTTIKKLHH